MAKRKEQSERKAAVLEPDAAGIDIGAEEIYVAVPPDRDEECVRKFSSFTCDLVAHPGRVAGTLLCPHRSYGVDGRVLDSVVPATGIARSGGVPGQRPPHQECSRAQE